MQAWEFGAQKFEKKSTGEEIRKVSWESDELRFKF